MGSSSPSKGENKKIFESTTSHMLFQLLFFTSNAFFSNHKKIRVTIFLATFHHCACLILIYKLLINLHIFRCPVGRRIVINPRIGLILKGFETRRNLGTTNIYNLKIMIGTHNTWKLGFIVFVVFSNTHVTSVSNVPACFSNSNSNNNNNNNNNNNKNRSWLLMLLTFFHPFNVLFTAVYLRWRGTVGFHRWVHPLHQGGGGIL